MANWKTELKDAYDKSAEEKVKQSDAAYQKKMAQVLGDTLARGLGRSSYATATQANLMDDMNQAENQIRTDFRLEYLKALQQREMEEARLELDRQKLFGYGGGGGGGGYGGYSGYNGGNDKDTGANNNSANTVNWWNVINSYEQKKNQSYVNTPGKATYSPTGLANVGLGKYATRTTR